jgi:hypothetical protein
MATIKIPVSTVYKLEVKSRPVRTLGQTTSVKCIEFYCRGIIESLFRAEVDFLELTFSRHANRDFWVYK